ncbi:cupin domain-containing protein [bacterium]|nr:MAG: cupin domain-containing protein [bacterium]
MVERDVSQLPWEATNVEGYEQKWLIRRSGASFKLVRIHAGARFPLHRHPDRTEYAYVLEGVLDATISGQTLRVGPGGFAEIPAGVEHGLFNPGSSDTIVQIGAITESTEP